MKIIFMGTPDFAVPALRALIDSDHEVIAVYSQPPRPKGRGHKVVPSPVHVVAEAHGIPVYTPTSLKSEEQQQDFAALKADVAVVAAYGLILPKAVLEAPRYGCLNIHASLLPRWRGAAPIQYAVWKGDSESGVTIMQMEQGLDTGSMIAKTIVPITGETTSSSLHDELAAAGAPLLLEVLSDIENMQAEPQDDEVSNYASMLKKEDGRIDWHNKAEEIERQIRALNPWPGTFTDDYKIKAAVLSDRKTDQPAGTILDKKGHIACGGGSVLQLLIIQPPDKKPMDFISAVNGGYITL